MSVVDLNLPNTFVFWDGQSHDGDLLAGRNIIQHVRSCTIIEILDEELGVYLKDEVKRIALKFTNSLGLKESLILAVHFSHAEFIQLNEILSEAKLWYLKYCEWQDKNILDE